MTVDERDRYRWLTTKEAMAHLGVATRSGLYDLIRHWKLPYGRLGRLYRFRRAELDEWMTAHRSLSLVRHQQAR